MSCAACSSASCEVFRLDSDNVVAFDDAMNQSAEPAVALTGAVVSAQLYDVTDAENPIALGSPIAMPEYPSAPSNDYRGTFFADSGAGFYDGQRVEVRIAFDGGAGLRGAFTFINRVDA